MKFRLMSIMTVLMLALVACNPGNGNTNDHQEGRQADDNVQQTRYNETRDLTDDGRNKMNRNDRNERNYTMDRNREHEGRENRGLTREDRDRDHRNNADNVDNYDVADEAADRITDDVKGIDRAYVLTTKNNAYVAAMMDKDHRDKNDKNKDKDKNRKRDKDDMNVDDGLTDEVKKEIKDTVKSVDNDIDNVYVSTNPDFFELTNDYVDDMNNGKPVRGFFDQFGDMIERLFPQNKR